MLTHPEPLPTPVVQSPHPAVTGSAKAAPKTGMLVIERDIVIDTVMIFRYVALTYNAHRIHYDEPYAKSEGFPGVVVPGPLTLNLLLELITSVLPQKQGVPAVQISSVTYRALAPLYRDGKATFRLLHDPSSPKNLIAECYAQSGALAMTATATFDRGVPFTGNTARDDDDDD